MPYKNVCRKGPAGLPRAVAPRVVAWKPKDDNAQFSRAMMICRECGASLLRKNLRRHLSEVHQAGPRASFPCPECPYRTHRAGDLHRHQRKLHPKPTVHQIRSLPEVVPAALEPQGKEVLATTPQVVSRLPPGREQPIEGGLPFPFPRFPQPSPQPTETRQDQGAVPPVPPSPAVSQAPSSLDLEGGVHFAEGNRPLLEVEPDSVPRAASPIRQPADTPAPVPRPTSPIRRPADIQLQERRLNATTVRIDTEAAVSTFSKALDQLMSQPLGVAQLKGELARRGYSTFSSDELRDLKQEVRRRAQEEAVAPRGEDSTRDKVTAHWRKALQAPVSQSDEGWMAQPQQLVINGTVLNFDLRVRAEGITITEPKRTIRRRKTTPVKPDVKNIIIDSKGDCPSNPITL